MLLGFAYECRVWGFFCGPVLLGKNQLPKGYFTAFFSHIEFTWVEHTIPLEPTTFSNKYDFIKDVCLTTGQISSLPFVCQHLESRTFTRRNTRGNWVTENTQQQKKQEKHHVLRSKLSNLSIDCDQVFPSFISVKLSRMRLC